MSHKFILLGHINDLKLSFVEAVTTKYGGIRCQDLYKSGIACRNGAYYISDGKYVCGIHSSKNNRVELVKSKPSEQKSNIEQLMKTIVP